ncbi:diacylglycerol kinase delta-like isoform X3 [Scyliorhinus canicula]|uniref:diacylglycerol kinase delta-like isoform X3 n=1 Tax=Scyliorhinus canicula TaxID=7830 RepID=UPI0018F6E0C9|nr:diacylglycerol kinase delta-like isoform X3 [Scyliorhinus canicula]
MMAAREAQAAGSGCELGARERLASGSTAGDESSDSEAEHESAQKLIRKVSTSGQIRSKAIIKEGLLMKQTSSFQRWKKRYFKLRGRTLYYAKNAKSIIFDEVDLTDASVAESSTKNVNNSFTVSSSDIITPFRKLILCAENRKEMEDWIAAMKTIQNRDHFESTQYSMDHFSGMHNWYACSHARPTYCNVCREALSGVTSHGLSCEVCKFKAHKRCAVRATNNCKWTTLASIAKDIIEDEDGVSMPHQWLEGNLPVSAKCTVCDKTCGSVLRLQDWRCLWCKAMVHTACKDMLPIKCPLGQCKVSVIPPTALNSIDSDGFWKATCPPSCTSPLLVFVNSKSGDNQGVKFLRRFKQLLNPAQVFDLMNGGPHLGLRLFQKFDTFRILVCGGDGSVGWVLSEIDSLNLHKQCQMGVLPLGTGNDLARVLGWGSACDDDTQLPQILEKLERASTKMLDRWGIMVYETKVPRHSSSSLGTEDFSDDLEVQQISFYEDSVAAHLSKILTSDQHSVVISSAKVLCETVKDFVARVGKAYERTTENWEESETMARKCSVLKEKLDSLLKTLSDESQAASSLPNPPPTIAEEQEDGETTSMICDLAEERPACSPRPQIFRPREQLMLRANSLKKAIRQIIEHAEKAVDEQNAQTQDQESYTFSLCSEEERRESQTDDKISLHSSYSSNIKGRVYRKVPKSPCERRISKGSLSIGSSSSLPTPTGNRDNLPMLNSKILYPSLRAGLAASLAGGSVISKMLFVHADTMNSEPDILNGYTEKCVMNNYFGIGLDAKISLDFNNKRDEHPEKCRSRTKNMMWYGVLGTKELLHRTYKNLEQKVLLECDGQRIPLPSLQGIAVLNIPSYAGGTNFWGGTKEDDIFTAPSFDDKILEVVAVFGSMQMAVSRVINLQHHRIAQCRAVKITILGDEGVPVQVDGEAWIQPPGYIKIIHKNRAQMLTRDRAFESTLKSWEDKQKCELPRPSSQYALQPEIVSEEEAAEINQFGRAAGTLIHRIRETAQLHHTMEQELAHAVNASAKSMDKVYAKSKTTEGLSCSLVMEMVNNGKALHNETELLLAGKMSLQLDPPQKDELTGALANVDLQLRKLAEIPWLYQLIEPSDDEGQLLEYSKRTRSAKFRLVSKLKKEKNNKNKETRGNMGLPVHQWGTEEVAAWLEHLSLFEYREIFIRHDIRGSELLHLERRDLKDLGIARVGHMKRILHGIKELSRNTPVSEV